MGKYDESKHPRGNPGNKGQFAKKTTGIAAPQAQASAASSRASLPVDMENIAVPAEQVNSRAVQKIIGMKAALESDLHAGIVRMHFETPEAQQSLTKSFQEAKEKILHAPAFAGLSDDTVNPIAINVACEKFIRQTNPEYAQSALRAGERIISTAGMQETRQAIQMAYHELGDEVYNPEDVETSVARTSALVYRNLVSAGADPADAYSYTTYLSVLSRLTPDLMDVLEDNGETIW